MKCLSPFPSSNRDIQELDRWLLPPALRDEPDIPQSNSAEEMDKKLIPVGCSSNASGIPGSNTVETVQRQTPANGNSSPHPSSGIPESDSAEKVDRQTHAVERSCDASGLPVSKSAEEVDWNLGQA